MDTSSPIQPRPASDQDELATGNLDKVRDILFGGQMRDTDKRFARLEERLTQEVAELKDDVRRRLSALEDYMKRETESLGARLRTEQDERMDAARELGTKLGDAVRVFERKTTQIDDTIARAQRDLGQQILDLNKTMSEEVRQKIDDVLARLQRASAELQHEKTDRAGLAALLTEMAMRLTNDLSIPGIDKERHG